jgi:hypothetical protein
MKTIATPFGPSYNDPVSMIIDQADLNDNKVDNTIKYQLWLAKLRGDFHLVSSYQQLAHEYGII